MVFDYYPITNVPISPSATLQLKSLPDLPLCDLVSLSSGYSDETGHSLWRGSLIFHTWLSGRLDLFKGRRLLELGTGCGSSGLYLALSLSQDPDCPTTHIALTDGDVDTVALASEVR
jgi:hypothetical protein